MLFCKRELQRSAYPYLVHVPDLHALLLELCGAVLPNEQSRLMYHSARNSSAGIIVLLMFTVNSLF